jgi:hypothetical protein
MIANLLGRILFPRRQLWQQEREAKVILAAAVVALIFVVVVGLLMAWRSSVIRKPIFKPWPQTFFKPKETGCGWRNFAAARTPKFLTADKKYENIT